MPFRFCPCCGRAGNQHLHESVVGDEELLRLIGTNAPGWSRERGLCPACLEMFRGALNRFRANPTIFRDGRMSILPTPLRVGASERYAGRGVTIAFLDSGFYPHPDLIEPRNRIVHYENIIDPEADAEELGRPDVSSWHGMMTSVVATGNGHLSGGVYRGIASEARVVLVKVGSAHRIRHDDIRRGVEWAIENRRRFDIRVINISCGGDYEESYLTDGLSHSVEEVARLAQRVVVIEAGRVKFVGAPPVAFSRLANAPGADRFGLSSVIEARAADLPASHGLTPLEHPAGRIWVAGAVGAPGAPVRVLVNATDVILSLSRPGEISTRSVLAGRVSKIEVEGPMASIEIALADNAYLLAAITRGALEDLSLEVGTSVFALFKSAALDETSVSAEGGGEPSSAILARQS